MTMAKFGKCNQIDIARKLGISGASVGVSVRRLEKAGLIKISNDANGLTSRQIQNYGEILQKIKENIQKHCDELEGHSIEGHI